MQIDNPERGFSYKFEGPLDLRLNPEKGISAAERLEDITRLNLKECSLKMQMSRMQNRLQKKPLQR